MIISTSFLWRSEAAVVILNRPECEEQYFLYHWLEESNDDVDDIANKEDLKLFYSQTSSPVHLKILLM